MPHADPVEARGICGSCAESETGEPVADWASYATDHLRDATQMVSPAVRLAREALDDFDLASEDEDGHEDCATCEQTLAARKRLVETAPALARAVIEMAAQLRSNSTAGSASACSTVAPADAASAAQAVGSGHAQAPVVAPLPDAREAESDAVSAPPGVIITPATADRVRGMAEWDNCARGVTLRDGRDGDLLRYGFSRAWDVQSSALSALRAALRKYGSHDGEGASEDYEGPWCGSLQIRGGKRAPCSCGLDAALADEERGR